MSDLADLQQTFESTFFKAACQDVLRIVSILSLDSLDISKPRHKVSSATQFYERFIFVVRFFYMVFIKGFTPAVFDIVPYHLWLAITLFVYVYRLIVLPFWLRAIGYGKYADWTGIGSRAPQKSDTDAQPLQSWALSKESNLSCVDFGDPDFQKMVARLYQLSAHLSPHSQSPGNPFVHSGFEGNFFDHLTGVYKILLAWKQPRYVVRGGFFHSVYGTFDYRSGIFDLRDGRQPLTDLIGPGAEELAFGICTSDRIGLLKDLVKAMYQQDPATYREQHPNSEDGNPYPPLVGKLTDEGFPVRNHITQRIHVLPPDYFAQFTMVFIADFMDQGALGLGFKDLDVCIFQFLRYRFYSDLILFVSPYLRVLPPVWAKYLGKNQFIEPTRHEVIEFKRIWHSLMEHFDRFQGANEHHKKRYQYTDITAKDKDLVLQMVKRYKYIAEPKIALAAIISQDSPVEKYDRASLVKEARELLEEWGMLTVKSGKYALKEVLHFVNSLV